MNRRLLALFSVSVASLAGIAEPLIGDVLEGTVYHDVDGDGALSSADRPIPGALVSNGSAIVSTDEKGRYRIEKQTGDSSIFLIKPRGFAPLPDGDAFHGFSYVFSENGSPVRQYPGYPASRPDLKSLDFPLFAQEEPDGFRLLVFGDSQTEFQQEIDWFAADIVNPLIGKTDADFGVVLGDIVNDDLTLFHPINAVISKLGIPFYAVHGNHDMNFDAPSDVHADDTFEHIYGPSSYAFQYGPVHFLVLDNVIFEQSSGKFSYIGGFRDDTLAFIENYLLHVPEDALLVLMMHIPLFEPEEWGDTFRDEDRQRLFDLLENHRNTLSLSSHTHTQRHHYFSGDQGWKGKEAHHHYNVGTTCGSWWTGSPDEYGIPHTMMRDGTPNGYAYIDFDVNTYRISWRVARGPENEVMRVEVPSAISYGEYPVGQVFVNVYGGCERTEVEYRFNNKGDWKPMRRQFRYDPTVMKIWAGYETSSAGIPGRRLNAPEICHHLWGAPLSTTARAGLHVVNVKVTDAYGRVFFDNATYRLLREE